MAWDPLKLYYFVLFFNLLQGDLRSRWEDNIKMDLKEVGCVTRSWMYVAEVRDQGQ